MSTGDSTNATFFLMADYSLDRSWAGSAAAVAFAPDASSSSGAPEGVLLVYSGKRRRSKRAAPAAR